MNSKKINFTEFEPSIPTILDESDFIVVLTVTGNELQMHTNLVMNLKNHTLVLKVLNETIKSLATQNN